MTGNVIRCPGGQKNGQPTQIVHFAVPADNGLAGQGPDYVLVFIQRAGQPLLKKPGPMALQVMPLIFPDQASAMARVNCMTPPFEAP